jgi:ribosomal-protein-alanine N-acetyltransferase
MTATLHLIEIDETGHPIEDVRLPDLAQKACETTAAMYQRTGFVRPWIGYIAVKDSQVVGLCGFTSPPENRRVEIAYYTFPAHEGQGVATGMARQMIQLSRASDSGIRIVARTLPEENASVAILRKLEFKWVKTVHDPEDGDVWEWNLTSDIATPHSAKIQ